MRIALACIYAMGALACGCARDALPGVVGEGDASSAGDAGALPDFVMPGSMRCTAPLMEYCGKGMCPNYEGAVLRARSEDMLPFCAGEAGTCGPWRYVAIKNGFDLDTMYFDAGGRLIAAHHDTDYNAYCDRTSFGIDYGPVPQCMKQVTEMFCTGRPDFGARD